MKKNILSASLLYLAFAVHTNSYAQNGCDINAINAAFTGAGYIPIAVSGQPCSMYFINPTSQAAAASEAQAQALGAHMVVFNDAAENTNVVAGLNAAGYGGATIWIGYQRSGTGAATFYALDGTTGNFPVPSGGGVYQNWAGGEPNNNGYNDCTFGCGGPFCSDQYRCENGEQCVQIYGDGMWNDLPCDRTSISLIEVNLCPETTADSDVTICYGDPVTFNTSAALLGSNPYTYAWTPPGDLNNPNQQTSTGYPVATTTYTVTVTDRYGCQATSDMTVTVNGAGGDAGPDATVCNGSIAQLNATGGVTYSWFPSTGLSATNIANPTASPTITTAYFCTITTADGCSITDDVTVTVSATAPINAGTDVAICPGASTNLTATGGTTYVWTPTTGLSDPNIANPVATPAATTTYTVNGTDANGCTGTDAVTVTVNPAAVANAGTDADFCIGGSTTLNGAGGTSYAWTPTTGLSDAAINNPVATPAATTTYTLTVTDANGCTDTDDVEVTVNPLPPADAGADVAVCTGSSTTLGASGGTQYSWSPTTDLSNPNIANPVCTPAAAITYTVTVTDNNGCVATDDVDVTINPVPVADAGTDASICQNSSTTLNGAGGVSYVWNPATGLDDATLQNPSASPQTTTTYTVTVTDANGCTATDDVDVTVTPSEPVDAGLDDSACSGDPVSLTATGNGVSFSWSPPTGLSSTNTASTTATLTSTVQYTVTMTDANGCTSSDDITVTINPIPVAAFSAAEVCNGEPTVFLNQSTVASGTIASYAWDFGDNNTSTLSGPSNTYALEDDYTVTLAIISDAGCTNTITQTVTVHPLPVVDFEAVPVEGCIPLEVQFNDLSTIASGNNVSWLWDIEGVGPINEQTTTQTFSNAGLYDATLTVTSDEGCVTTLTQSNLVTVHPNPDAQFYALPERTEILYPEITFTDLSSGEPTTWSWDFGGTGSSTEQSPVYNFPDTGTFTVLLEIANQYGCTDTVSHTVVITPSFTIYVPSAFTPDGDGVNDIFLPKGIGWRDYELRIFSRSGTQVFSTFDPTEGWDGQVNHKGKVTIPDVYVWRIYVRDKNNRRQDYKGTVTLIR
ncbi:MAG: PKD domain-containing protein [Bacteroidia bacterium]